MGSRKLRSFKKWIAGPRRKRRLEILKGIRECQYTIKTCREMERDVWDLIDKSDVPYERFRLRLEILSIERLERRAKRVLRKIESYMQSHG